MPIQSVSQALGNEVGGSPFGFKNRLINGNMQIWQRGTSFSAPNTVAYTADRWMAMWGSANRTYSRQAGFAGSQYCFRVQKNAGTNDTSYQGIAQIIESVNILDLAGQQVTLSFDLRVGANYSQSGGVLQVYSSIGTVADEGSSQYWSPGWAGSNQIFSQNITPTTTSRKYSFTFTVPSNALEMIVGFQYNSNGTAGAADYFEVTNVQLEKGVSATSFDYRPITTETLLCQRYYYHYETVWSLGVVYNGTAVTTPPIQFPVIMRVAPTGTGIKPSHISTEGYWGVYGATNGWGGSGIPISINCNPRTAQIQVTPASGLTDHYSYLVDGGAWFTAEL